MPNDITQNTFHCFNFTGQNIYVIIQTDKSYLFRKMQCIEVVN